MTVSVTCFEPCADAGSEAFGTGGRYVTVTGVCRGVDAEVTQTIRIDDMTIDLGDVLLIEGPAELFRQETGEAREQGDTQLITE